MANRRRKRKSYSIERFKCTLSTSLRELERIILTANDDDQIIKASNSLATLANSYRNLVEASDILERIEELERRIS